MKKRKKGKVNKHKKHQHVLKLLYGQKGHDGVAHVVSHYRRVHRKKKRGK